MLRNRFALSSCSLFKSSSTTTAVSIHNFRLASDNNSQNNNSDNNNNNNNSSEQHQNSNPDNNSSENNNNEVNSTENSSATKQSRQTRGGGSSSQSSRPTVSISLPQGWEVYLSCVGIIGGWWYWNEASYRRVDRSCETLETQARERTKQLSEVVKKTDSCWHDDVRGKEAMLNKVQHENVRLAKLLDDVSNYLKKCEVPLDKQK